MILPIKGLIMTPLFAIHVMCSVGFIYLFLCCSFLIIINPDY